MKESKYVGIDAGFLYAGVRILLPTLDAACDHIIDLAKRNERAVAHLCNAHVLGLAATDTNYRLLFTSPEAVNYPDGAPVAWVGSWRMRRRRGPIRGSDLMRSTIKGGAEHGLRHYVFGSNETTLRALQERLRQDYPLAIIAGVDCPAYTGDMELLLTGAAVRVKEAQADVVWVGLGTPKQDWAASALAEQTDRLCITVGAAFAFIAGTEREAPRWLRGSGFEWLFRLASEPARLWRRYLFGSWAFLAGLRK